MWCPSRPDASKIFVCVGFGFFVEFTLTEAVNFIDKKCSHLTSLSESLTQDAARIKAHIRLVLEVSFNLFMFVFVCNFKSGLLLCQFAAVWHSYRLFGRYYCASLFSLSDWNRTVWGCLSYLNLKLKTYGTLGTDKFWGWCGPCRLNEHWWLMSWWLTADASVLWKMYRQSLMCNADNTLTVDWIHVTVGNRVWSD